MSPAAPSDALEEALDRLSDRTYFDGPGLPAHGPMVAEALCALGRDDAAPAWVDRHRRVTEPVDLPPRCERIEPGQEASWRAALGDVRRLADWDELFARELASAPWGEVARRWVPALLPGSAGAQTHGLIRTAHAVRALGVRPGSDLCVRELGRGLALWAATATAVPGPRTLGGPASLEEAVARLPPAVGWTVAEAASLSRLGEVEGFVPAVEALAPLEGDPLGRLVDAFGRAVVELSGAALVPLVHAVTATAAARLLLPLVPPEAGEEVVATAWRTGAAVLVSFAGRPAPQDRPAPEVVALGWDDLAERARAGGDAHAIKVVEACWREHRLDGGAALHAAAAHVVDRLAPG